MQRYPACAQEMERLIEEAAALNCEVACGLDVHDAASDTTPRLWTHTIVVHLGGTPVEHVHVAEHESMRAGIVGLRIAVAERARRAH